ncbi:MAG: GAF domain-containing protein [Candidatus Nanopelagicales bacterium]
METLESIAEAAAESFRVTFSADTASVSLIRGGEYRTLVNVGVLFPGDTRFPTDEFYETSYYPTASAALLAGDGYFSSIGVRGTLPESDRLLRELDRGSCMGVPLTYLRETLGEVFVTRPHGDAVFDGDDLSVAMELTRQLGFRVGPALLKRLRTDSTFWPSASA